MRDILNKYNIDKKKLIGIGIFVILFFVALPLILVQVQNKQQIRQRAETLKSLHLELNPSQFTIDEGTTFYPDINLLNPNNKDISAVDMILSYNSDILEFISFIPGSGGLSIVTSDITSSGKIHLVLSNPERTSVTDSTITLGSITFRGKIQGEGNIDFENVVITATGEIQPLAVNPQDNDPASYTVGASITQSASTTPSPNACIVMPSLPLKVPILALEYFPPDPANPNLLDGVEIGWGKDTLINREIKFWEQKADEMIDALIGFMNQSTIYHGYKDPTSPQFLNFYVLERKKIYEPIPKGVKYEPNKAYRPNYAEILKKFNICDYVDNKGVKEVWMYGYHNENENGIEPNESKMSSKYGDISNASPKEERLSAKYRIPVCSKAYTLYNFIYQPVGTNKENYAHIIIHQIENVIPFTEGKWPPIGENKPGSNIKGSIFWGNFSEYVQDYTNRNAYISSCGNAHYAPNWRTLADESVYSISEKNLNNCETWNPDSSKSTYVNTKSTYVNANCSQWGCTELGFYQWYMQNMPGYNNNIVYNGQKMRNWWEAMYDFNAFIDKGRSLYGDSIFCSGEVQEGATESLVGDLNGDGKVTQDDSAFMIGLYGQKGENMKADLDHNGVINEYDYNILLKIIADLNK